MAKLSKNENGLIFYDDFKEPTLLWTLSPSDANNLRFGENGLIMAHDHRYTTFTMTEPEVEEYSCIVELNHVPYNTKDIGGVIIVSNNEEYAECQSFLATGPSEITNFTVKPRDVFEIIQPKLDNYYVRYSLDDNENTGEQPYIELPMDTTQPESVFNAIQPILDNYYVRYSSDDDENTENSSNEDSNVESFVDTFYRFIKFTKQKYKYIFWASNDGIHWIEVGSTAFKHSGLIGFFLYGTDNQELIENSYLNIKSISIYVSRYLIIESIPKDYDFEIIDENDQILLRTDSTAYTHIMNRSNNRCLINTTAMPTPIKNAHLRMYPKRDYDTTIATYDLGENVYGGDVFSLEHNIKAFIHNKEVDPTRLFDLGALSSGGHYILMAIKNCEEYELLNIKLRVTAYSEYYSGHEEIELALSMDGVPDINLKYAKEITIAKLDAGASIPVYMKLTDKMMNMFYHAANIYRFKITIE